MALRGCCLDTTHGSGRSVKMAHRMFISENKLGLSFQKFHYEIFFLFPEEIMKEKAMRVKDG